MNETGPENYNNSAMIQSVCVFCASSQSVPESFKEVAYDLGQRLAHERIELVYGGASIGLMGCVARGAHAGAGRIIGILPYFFMGKGIDYQQTDEMIVTKDIRERKAIMDSRSDAFIALPGGVGTLEETIEILSLIQLKQTTKPLILINTHDFYRELIDWFEKMIRLKFAKPDTLGLFYLAKDPSDAIQFLKDFRPQVSNGYLSK